MKAVHILLDETGSMASMRDEAISGYNKYLDGLDDQDNLLVALTKFDTVHHTEVHGLLPPKEAVRLNQDNYVPGAGTPLFDSIAKVISRTNDMVAENNCTDALIVILTDGLENASREVNQEQINKLIKEQEEKGWSFIYLGVAADAWQNEGVFAGTKSAQNAYRSTGGKGVLMSMHSVATATMDYAASAPRTTVQVSDEEKEKVWKESN